ncbi:MAG: GNAT family N-acetyltransferase [Anaerolineae bacterium]
MIGVCWLDHAYRRCGIGTLMLRSLIDIARRLGLQQLYIKVVTKQHRVIKTVQDLV